jgi:hypothetical protein
MPAQKVVEAELHEFFTSELDKCEWLASGPSHFTGAERVPIATQQKVGWSGGHS